MRCAVYTNQQSKPRVRFYYPCWCIQLLLSILHSAKLFPGFRQTGFSFFPFCRTHRGKSVRLSTDCRPREQVPKHHPAITIQTLSRGDTCRRGSYTHDDDQGADDIHSGRDKFSPNPTHVTTKQTVEGLLLFTPFVCGKRRPSVLTNHEHRGWEHIPEHVFWHFC